MRSAGLVIATTALALSLTGALSTAFARAQPCGAQASAVRKAWERLDLELYFGPPAAICSRMTRGDRGAFARATLAHDCLSAARTQERTARACPSTGGITPAQWRAAVRFNVAHLRVTILSPTRARTVDPELITQTLVKVRGRWLFARGWPTVQC